MMVLTFIEYFLSEAKRELGSTTLHPHPSLTKEFSSKSKGLCSTIVKKPSKNRKGN